MDCHPHQKIFRSFFRVFDEHIEIAVVIEDTEADLYVAIDRAADRAGRTLERRLARQREFAPTLPVAEVDADWVDGLPGASQP